MPRHDRSHRIPALIGLALLLMVAIALALSLLSLPPVLPGTR